MAESESPPVHIDCPPSTPDIDLNSTSEYNDDGFTEMDFQTVRNNKRSRHTRSISSCDSDSELSDHSSNRRKSRMLQKDAQNPSESLAVVLKTIPPVVHFTKLTPST